MDTVTESAYKAPAAHQTGSIACPYLGGHTLHVCFFGERLCTSH